MTIEEQLKQFILSKYGTLTKFGEHVGLSQSTLSTIFKRGIQRTSITRIFMICDELGISADALAEGKIMPKGEWGKEIVNLELALNRMYNSCILAVNDVPLTNFELNIVASNIYGAIDFIKRRRSEIEKTTGHPFEEVNNDNELFPSLD